MGAKLFVSGWILLSAISALGFVGKDNTEAWLRFSHFVDIPAEREPSRAIRNEIIEDQLQYLFGPMSMVEKYSVPKGDHSVKLQKGEWINEGIYRAYYDYEGLIQVKRGPRTRYPVILPRQVKEEFIYTPGISKKTKKNLCTEDYHNSFGDFWYFWAPKPYYEKCPLVEGVHYDIVDGALERIENTKQTYPEYDRLLDADGTVPIYIFVGMDNPDLGLNPLESEEEGENDDINAASYRAIRSELVDLGFSEPERLSKEEMDRILKGRRFRRPFVERLRKENTRGTLEVTLFFGRTGIDENSKPFHYFYKEANERAAILIYDGHSGLGGHLDLENIEATEGFKIRMPRRRYQIFFFNSCTSYSYYNTLYFYRKQGKSTRYQTKNLDILTAGLATEFEVDQKTNMALIHAVDAYTRGQLAPSYQTLAKKMDQNNLFGVNGDEDNPDRMP